jgi:RNA polymerase sigma factor (sigma-70 family)
MPAEMPGDLLHRLPRLWAAEAARDLADGELLERFLARREEVAFAVLVQRHGPMVLGVCRRLLADSHSAEDAFQAAFLILARRAAAIRKKASLASWLHGVARRVALRARAQAAARRSRERRPREMPQMGVLDQVMWEELRTVLDEAIGELPERFRAAVVLCHLEGKSYDEAARELGWPKSSLASRLAKAHRLLRARLVRRGVALSAGALAAGLVGGEARAAVPALLTINTVKGAMAGAFGKGSLPGPLSERAVALAEGAMKGNFGTKSKVFAALVALGLLAGGVGLAAHQGRQEDGQGPAAAPGKAGGGRVKATRLLVTASLPDDAPGRAVVLAIDPETGAWTKLADPGWGSASASPDGKAVLFVRDGKLVYRCDTAGGGRPTKVCEAALTIAGGPVWSRDGRQFYLSTCRMRGAALGLVQTWYHETRRCDADGGNPVLLKLPAELFVIDLSPDGKSFLSGSQTLVRRSTVELGVIRTDGTGYRRLSEAGGVNIGRFSPDGQRVAYCRLEKDSASVLVVGIDGEGRKKVFGGPGTGIVGCCWSPDGQRLAVLANDFDGKQTTRWRIELLSADGKDRRTVPLKAKVGILQGPDWYAVP